jgi:ABC-2 type transport system permease protein
MRKTTRSRSVGMMEQMSLMRFLGPLPLGQSIQVVLPYIIFLVALTAVCFAVSYTVFMRQEIRSI